MSPWNGRLVDCDIHVNVTSMHETLFPYMSGAWQSFVVERGYAVPPGVATVYPPGAPTSARPEWRPQEGVPAASLEAVKAEALDAREVEHAIANCYWAIDSCRHPDLAAALAAAINDWLVAEWLEKDERLRASLVIPLHTVADAVREVERLGSHPGFVQALLPVRAPQLYGKRNWWPLLEALERHDLVLGIHWGGTSDGAPTPCGWPSWYAEEMAGEIQVYMAQLLSLIAEGTFQRFPGLRVAMLEGGFSWGPSLLWRLDKEWKGLRRSVPWMNERPSDLVRRHVRWSTAPIGAGSQEQMANIIEWLGADLLMFSSDYPHDHGDDLDAFLQALPASHHDDVMSLNASSWYRIQ